MTFHRIVLGLLTLIIIGGCERFSSKPQLNSRTESKVMETFVSAKSGDIESPWEELEATLGPSEIISFEEFLKVTGYNLSEPPQVECRIWRNSSGEWLAIAYDPDAKSLSGIKSYMRR